MAVSRGVLVAAALIGCALGAGAGCSGSAGDGGQGGSGAAASSAPIDEFINAYCGLTRTCCARAGLPAQPLTDCEAEVERQLDLISAVRQGKATLIEPAFGECLSTLGSLTGSCDAARIGPGCSRFWEGTIPEGGGCENVVECQLRSDAVACVVIRPPGEPDATMGNCRSLSRGALGDPCLASSDGSVRYALTYSTSAPAPPLVYCDARDGVWCALGSRVCEPLIPEGGSCDFGGCEVGRYCDTTCKPYKAAGESCASFAECAFGSGCVEGTCGPVPISATKLCEGDYT